MKNLKKVLALVLAFACAFTMFAGAAFTDSADIKVDTEVVDTLVSLGVVNGYDDGSFKPNGAVTRAEMAKMIYSFRGPVILTLLRTTTTRPLSPTLAPTGLAATSSTASLWASLLVRATPSSFRTER